MFGKFVFVCLAALCAMQGFQAGSVEPRSIADIIAKIKDILKEIKEAANISEIIKKLEELLKNILDKINDFDIAPIITKIQDKIDEILAGAGLDPSAARECNDAQKPAIERMANDAKHNFTLCANNVADEVKNVITKANQVKDSIETLDKDIHDKIDMCIKEGGIDVKKIIECLEGQVKFVKQEVDKIAAQILETVKAFNKIIFESPIKMATCVADVNKHVLDAEIKIISDIKQCIEDHKAFFVQM